MKINEHSLRVLRECVDERVPVIFSADGWSIVYQALVIAVHENSIVIANRVPPQHISKVMKATGFGLHCKMLRFISKRVESDGENMVFVLADLEQLEETRQAERFPFDNEERVICEIKNPVDQKTVLVKSVLDMSATGISIRCSKQTKLFRPGTKFPELKVVIDGNIYQKTSGTVVYSRQLMDLSGRLRVQVGLKFDPAT
jgi:hypothetical protein